jgi:heme/copper-type cytochrome/quinol oxidase subunit 2
VEQLYKNYWADESCLGAALQVLALSTAVIAAVVVLLGLFTWLILRRQAPAERRANARVFTLMFGGCAVLLMVVAVYATFVTKSLRRIWVADGGFVFEVCEGPRAVKAEIAASDIAGISYQWRWSGGRTSEQLDELVITSRAGEPVIMRLSTDPDVLNFPLLKRVVPPEAISAWIAARRERGWSIPPDLAAIE